MAKRTLTLVVWARSKGDMKCVGLPVSSLRAINVRVVPENLFPSKHGPTVTINAAACWPRHEIMNRASWAVGNIVTTLRRKRHVKVLLFGLRDVVRGDV